VPRIPILLVKFIADNQVVQEAQKISFWQGDFPRSLAMISLAKSLPKHP
jgi:hypothetical protein